MESKTTIEYEIGMKLAGIAGGGSRFSGMSDSLQENSEEWLWSSYGIGRIRGEVRRLKNLHEEIGNRLFQLTNLLEQSKAEHGTGSR